MEMSHSINNVVDQVSNMRIGEPERKKSRMIFDQYGELEEGSSSTAMDETSFGRCLNECGEESVVSCEECQLLLCESCFDDIHKQPVFKKHEKSFLVEDHTCDTSVDHEDEVDQKQADAAMNSLRRSIEQITEQRLKIGEQLLRVTNHLHRAEVDRLTIERELDLAFDLVRQKVEEHRLNLVSQLQTFRASHLSNIHKREQQLIDLQQTIDTIINDYKQNINLIENQNLLLPSATLYSSQQFHYIKKLLLQLESTFKLIQSLPNPSLKRCIIHIENLPNQNLNHFLPTLSCSETIRTRYEGSLRTSFGPYGIDISVNDDIYITHRVTNQIKIYSSNSETPKSTFWSSSPEGIAVDRMGTMYVSDSDHGVVRVLNHIGQNIQKIGLKSSTAPNGLLRPKGLCLDESHSFLFVADSSRDVVQMYTSEGEYIKTFPELINDDSNDNLSHPVDVAVSKGRLYVVDWGNERIQVYNIDTGVRERTIGKKGGGKGEFEKPVSVKIDKGGLVVVGEGGGRRRVQWFEEEGRFVGMFDGAMSESGSLNCGYSMAVRSDGTVYVCDVNNARIVKIKVEG
eukprot:TRINITY_DN15306_c0_g1_i1.p1 TRINITY_DN15306_c0_g1~~TRINITY_DN15306_c0_g1_i1.p1  ORF type:complete len:603 (-),score=154.52 TRINITY_DN15306_c0_g1_i1:11-1720(-)